MENDLMPFFSVIVPLYNKEKYVERALLSILSQQENDFEVIVIDDGSTDNGAQKVRDLSSSKIKLYSQSNLGVSAARNKGMQLASGQWFAFLDADDMWSQYHLAELRQLISMFPDSGIVGTSSCEVLEGGDIGFLEHLTADLRRRPINYFEEASYDIGAINTSSVAVSRMVFDELGGFKDYRYGEDLEYWARIALNYSVGKSERQTVVYYRGNGGVMESMGMTALSYVPLPNRLSDISPSVAMLAATLDDLTHKPKLHRTVVFYINSRLIQSIRGSFIRGDILRMKASRALCLRPLAGRRQRGWWLLAGLPSVVLSALSQTRAFFKRFYLKLKG